MITVKKAKAIREDLNLTHIVIFGITPNQEQYVVTHGMSKIHAAQAAEMGNRLKKHLGWPPNLCDTKPLERKCENCSFWQRKKHDPGYPIPEKWSGSCMFNPIPVSRFDQDIACACFDPNR